MKNKPRFLLSFFFLILSIYGYAINDYTLSQIDYTDGLSNSAVLSLQQDSKGFMWFGTYDGLNNYDGKNMRVYRTDMTTENKLLSNVISQINNAGDDCLWISTPMGLNLFSLRTCNIIDSYESFTSRYKLFSNHNGSTWVIDKGDIFYYKNSLHQFMKVKGRDRVFATELSFVDEKGYLWLFAASENSVYRCCVDDSKKEDNFSTIRANIHQKRIVYTSYQDGILCFVDEESDLFLFDLVRNTKIYIRNVAELIEKYGIMKGIVPFGEDIIIAFIENGLIKLDAASRYSDSVINRNLRVFSIYKDPVQNIIWIGTDGQGAMMYTKKQLLGTHILFNQMQNKLSRQVRSISTDKQGNLWFGTKGDGLVKIENYEENSKNYFPYSASTVYFPNVKRMFQEYSRGWREYQVFGIVPSQYFDGFWIGSAENPGLSYYDYDEDNIIPLYDKENILQRVHCVHEENDTTLWITTSGSGLCKVILDKSISPFKISSVKQFLFEEEGQEMNNFFALVVEGDSLLWLGSRGSGLLNFNIKTEKHEHFLLNHKGKSSMNDVLAIYRKEKIFYLGTTSGLVRLDLSDRKQPKLSYTGKEHGLLNDMIHGILEDENGYLWLSTNKGLVKYNTSNGAFYTYYYNNGLQIGEFSDDAFYKCPYSGNMFFGGIDGLLYLESDKVSEINYEPTVEFRDLMLGVDAVNFYDYYDELTQTLLLHGYSVSFSLSFIAPDFIEGNNFEYSYQLEGADDNEWTPFSSYNVAAFNSLKHGSYLLKIRYKKDVFDADSTYYALKILIQPPWYLSRIAYIIYILLLVLVIIYIVRVIRQFFHNQRLIKRLMEQEMQSTSVNSLTGKLHEATGSFAIIYSMCGKLHQFKSMPDEYYQMLDTIHETVLSFAFNAEGGWSETLSLENYIPKAPALFAEMDVKQLSDEILSMLENRGYTNRSQFLVEIEQELRVLLPKNRVAYLLYYIYSLILESSNAITLLICREKESLLLKTTLPTDIIKKLVNVENDKNVVSSRFESHLYLWLYKYALKVLKVELTNNETDLSIRIPLQSIELIKGEEDKKKVLLLEDKDEISWLVNDLLSKSYTVHTVSTIQEAFSYLRKSKPDVFIADTMIYFKQENKFIEYLEVNRGLLADCTFIPMLTWKSAFVLQKRFEKLVDGFVVMPHSILFLKEIIERATGKKALSKEVTQFDFSEERDVVCHTDEQARFAKQFIQILEEHLDKEELNASFIAENMNISTRQYYRRFKEVFNLSSADFIKSYRIEKASQLLLEPNKSIQEVIDEVGIQSRSYFYKEFAARYGVTPKAYKKAMLDKKINE